MARILVVDEQPSVCMQVTEILQEVGHEVHSEHAGEEALRLCRAIEFDVVLVDLQREAMKSLDLLKVIRHEQPEISVVIMSGVGSIEAAVDAMRLGAQDYLRKPINRERLIGVVQMSVKERTIEHRGALEESDPLTIAAESGIIGRSRAIRELMEMVLKIARTDSSVLITGETGTGKELVGRAIHRLSPRVDKVFSAINSAAFPETLLESELFGHRRGAFTGASSNKKGIFEHAHGGTVFLDEVADMPAPMQVKLLRFLQTGEIRPVGSECTRFVDVRLVAASNKPLEEEVAAGRFREDLYYRLAVIPIHVPALRERLEDISVLSKHFIKGFAKKLGKRITGLDPRALDVLMTHDWPGNVRQLENSIERGAALCRGERIMVEDMPIRLREASLVREGETIQSLQVMERAHILSTLERVGWNRKQAAELLQISTTTLWRRLKEFGIEQHQVGDGALKVVSGPGPLVATDR
ncbi:MAG: sigma-54-dependent Fis family transcriptional regulator [Myxococcales bacterium]|nr:sigma-54-dependent Fis family transcriptional regulator [Myxococcales bacterium]